MVRSLNAFLVTVDSLRADAVGYAAGCDVETPNIDALAEQSLICSNAFANAPYTVASFPALLTGTYAWMYGGYPSVSSARPFVAEQFQGYGYDTAGFHTNPYLDARFGYDRGFSKFYDSERSMTWYSRLQQGVKELLPENSRSYRAIRNLKNVAERFVGEKIGLPYLPADALTDEVESWLAMSEPPAFGWVHYMDVHNPYLPKEGCQSSDIEQQRALMLHHRLIEAPEDLNAADLSDLKRLYLGEVEFLDRQIGRLVDAIDDQWGLDRTVIAFVSDHGEGFGEWGYYSHVVDELHDDLLCVPLLVRVPERDGAVVDELVATIDIPPTLLSESGVPVPESHLGINVASVDGRDNDRLLYAQAGNRDDGKVAVGNVTWRLVRNVDDGSEVLYRRDGDYVEASVPLNEYEDAVARLGKALDDHLKQVDERQTATAEVEVTSEVQDRLEQLGYR